MILYIYTIEYIVPIQICIITLVICPISQPHQPWLHLFKKGSVILENVNHASAKRWEKFVVSLNMDELLGLQSWKWNCRYPFSHNPESGKWLYLKGSYYWRDPFLTSMIMGGMVVGMRHRLVTLSQWSQLEQIDVMPKKKGLRMEQMMAELEVSSR